MTTLNQQTEMENNQGLVKLSFGEELAQEAERLCDNRSFCEYVDSKNVCGNGLGHYCKHHQTLTAEDWGITI